MTGTESRVRHRGYGKTGNLEESVDKWAGAWYYTGIVSLFIEKENDYEQEKSDQSEDNCPLLQAFP